MQPLPTQIFKPDYVQMKQPETTFEAAFRLAQLPRGTSLREARRNNPRVTRIQRQLQKAALVYDDDTLPDRYRLEHGIPTAWDGGIRVMERVQVDRWWQRRITASKRPRYKELEGHDE